MENPAPRARTHIPREGSVWARRVLGRARQRTIVRARDGREIARDTAFPRDLRTAIYHCYPPGTLVILYRGEDGKMRHTSGAEWLAWNGAPLEAGAP